MSTKHETQSPSEPVTITPFLRVYIECALWSSHDESDESGGEPMDENYDADDLAPECLARMAADCARFQRENANLLKASELSDEQAGYDFWLTRNGHGTGFWDRKLGRIGSALSDACKAWPGCELYVGDDGRIYC